MIRRETELRLVPGEIDRHRWDGREGREMEARSWMMYRGLDAIRGPYWLPADASLEDVSAPEPYLLGLSRGREWWLYEGKVYSTAEENLLPSEIRALIEEKANKRRLKIDRAKTIAAMAENLDRAGRRQPIPREIKVGVWQRDGGRCVQCGSNADLEFDHIVPLALGGSNTERNIQLLCATCNREKGASL